MKILAVCAAFITTGCAGLSHVAQYTGLEKTIVETETGTYWIWDKPTENRLLVASSPGATLGQGVARGLTFGAAGGTIKPNMTGAAAAYFAKTSRQGCQIVDAYLIIEPEWEIRYACPA